MPNEDPKPIDEAALDDPAMVELAVGILDGAPVDWPAVESGVRTCDEALLRQLRVLAGIGALHRSLPSAPSDPAARVESPPREGLGHWGPLTLLERIGEGAFGEVFRAWDPELHREVALKLLHPGRDADAASPLAEGRLLARIRHPNVVTVYGGASHDGRAGLWMEFVRGRTLTARLREGGSLPVADITRIGVSLCEALSAVHTAGLLHRDVKAQNVMMEDDGRVVLMDFGAGRDQSARAADMAGTPLYLAPEVFAGGSPSAQSDVYSMGVLLFYLLTTSYPVVADTAADLAAAHKGSTRTSFASVRPDVPARLAAVIDRALAPSPLDRFATAEAMATELRATVDAGARTPPRRYALAVLSLAMVATLGSLAATGVLRRWLPSASPASIPRPFGLTQHRLPIKYFAPVGPPSHDGRMLPGLSSVEDGLILLDPRTGTRRTARDPATPLEALGIGNAIISPDGRRVACDYTGRITEGTQIRILDIETMTSRPIYRTALTIHPVGWTPDGSRLLVRRSIGATEELAWLDVPAGTLTPLVTLEGTPRTVTLSPDGRTVAFDLTTPPAGGQSDLFLLDLVTRHRRPLVEPPSHDQYPVWTTDGSAVVFVSDRGGNSGLWKQAVTRGQPVDAPVLIVPSPGIVQPAGLDDSGALYYGVAPQAAFWTADIDLRHGGVSPPTVVPVNVRGVNMNVDWSRDETRIAYITQRTELTAGLAIHDLISGAEQFFPIGPVGQAHWSPDGRSVVFAKSRGIAVLTVADGRMTVVAGGPFVNPSPSWSADGRFIVFLDRTKDAVSVCQLDPKSGRRQVLFTIGADLGYLGGYTVSNHGDRIVLTTQERSTNQLVFSVWDAATHTVRELVRPPRGGMGVAGWSPNDQEIIMSRRAPQGDVELLAYTANGSAPRSLGWLRVHGDDFIPIPGVSLSPTGTRLRFTMGPDHQTTWAIEGFLGTAKPTGR